jgi:hypothetical protein
MNLTASALPRAAVCPGSVVLPQADIPNEHSEAGAGNHDKLEHAVKAGRLEELPEEVRALIRPGALASAEVAVAYDLAADKARLLGLGIGRTYETTATELAGTIDLQIVEGGTRATVVDYKRWEDVGAPDENEQTMFYALATARLLSLSEVTLVVAYVTEDEHGDIVLIRPLVTRVVDELDLDAFAHRLRWIAGRVAEQAGRATPDVRESRHCRRCNAVNECPAKVALIRRVVSGAESNYLESMLPLNEETAAIAWVQVGHAKNLLGRVTRALYAFAKERPFKLPDGRIVGEYEKTSNESLVGDVVHAVVAEKHGRDVADKAVIYSATKVRLEAALREAGVPVLSKAKDEVLIEVRRRGGAKTERKTEIGEHPPKLKLLNGGST